MSARGHAEARLAEFADATRSLVDALGEPDAAALERAIERQAECFEAVRGAAAAGLQADLHAVSEAVRTARDAVRQASAQRDRVRGELGAVRRARGRARRAARAEPDPRFVSRRA